jgi:hypothetical protein
MSKKKGDPLFTPKEKEAKTVSSIKCCKPLALRCLSDQRAGWWLNTVVSISMLTTSKVLLGCTMMGAPS